MSLLSHCASRPFLKPNRRFKIHRMYPQTTTKTSFLPGNEHDRSVEELCWRNTVRLCLQVVAELQKMNSNWTRIICVADLAKHSVRLSFCFVLFCFFFWGGVWWGVQVQERRGQNRGEEVPCWGRTRGRFLSYQQHAIRRGSGCRG